MGEGGGLLGQCVTYEDRMCQGGNEHRPRLHSHGIVVVAQSEEALTVFCTSNQVPGSGFRLVQRTLPYPRLGEFLPDLSGKDEVLTRSSTIHRKSLYNQIRIKISSTTSRRSRVCVAHP